jgi:hypothetical protein
MNPYDHVFVSLNSPFTCLRILESLLLGMGGVSVMDCYEWTVICTQLLAKAKGYAILQSVCAYLIPIVVK